MTNKVKFNRFETYIPTENNGIVITNFENNKLETLNVDNIIPTYIYSTVSTGLNILISNNILTIKKGHTYLDTSMKYYISLVDNKLTFNLYENLWNHNYTSEFEPMTLIVNNIQTNYTSRLFNTNGDGGKDNSAVNGGIKYFLVKLKNDLETKTMIITSYNNVPLMNDGDILLDYVELNFPIYYNEYNTSKLKIINEDLALDLNTYWLPETRKVSTLYNIWMSEQNVIILENNYALNPNTLYKKIGYFVTASDNANNIVRYFPHNDLATDYQNRYIIKEQIGTTGYRIYSDGWKEQWGNLVNPIFPVAFNEVPLIVTRGATNITRTGMTLAAGYWFAKGY